MAQVFVKVKFLKPWRRRIFFDDKAADGSPAPLDVGNSVDYAAGDTYAVKLIVAHEAIALGLAVFVDVHSDVPAKERKEIEKSLAATMAKHDGEVVAEAKAEEHAAPVSEG